MRLPTDKQKRKETPIFSGVVSYFPLSLAAMARVSWVGNKQHNDPTKPMHWDREKSTDQLDAAMRHLTEYAMGNTCDDDGEPHLAKAMWRIGAQLQLDEEKSYEKSWREGTLWAANSPASPHITEVVIPESVQRPNVHEQMREFRMRDD